MLYTIIFILLVAVAALAVWVWELSCKFSLLNEDGMNCSSPQFRAHPQWQYHLEQVFSRLESLEESVFPDEEPYNPLFEISTF